MGLSSRTMVRRLRAWHLGEPLTRGQTIHTATAARNDRLLLAFVKMGGETRPWAIAWKSGSKRLEFRFVPEPRFRAGVDAMATELGPVLAEHLQHPDLAGTEAAEASDLAPLRQIWVPNRSHIDMLHHFGYTYPHRKKEREHAEELRLLGRTALYVFLESERPGLFGMAGTAYPLPLIGKIVIGPLGEPVAAQTGDGILKDGMVGTEHQAGHLVSMAGDTKAGVIA